MKHIAFTILFAGSLLLGTLLFLAQNRALVLHALRMQEDGDVANRIWNKGVDVLRDLTLGGLDLGSERRERQSKLLRQEAAAQGEANVLAGWTGVALALGSGLALVESERTRRRRKLAALAGVCWLLGFFLPVLMMTVKPNMPLVGEIVLREEVKSLALMLDNLWAQGKYLFLGLIGVFGLGVPLVKIVCHLLPDHFTKAHQVGDALARWSFVDVIVIGVVVVFLGSQGENSETQAVIGLGCWFFAASGAFGMVCGINRTKQH